MWWASRKLGSTLASKVEILVEYARVQLVVEHFKCGFTVVLNSAMFPTFVPAILGAFPATAKRWRWRWWRSRGRWDERRRRRQGWRRAWGCRRRGWGRRWTISERLTELTDSQVRPAARAQALGTVSVIELASLL